MWCILPVWFMPFLGALCPSKSGLMNKHIVKHIVKHIAHLIFGCPVHIVGALCRVNDPFLGALYPSKSGLMNKHIVKHTGVVVL